jgi:hypothetical protein
MHGSHSDGVPRVLKRFLVSTCAILVAGAIGTVSRAVGGPATARIETAHAASMVHIADTAHLHLLKASGSTLHEAGAVSGTLSGSMQATLDVGASLTGEFTIYTSRGTIKGRGTAVPHGSGRYESFGGTIVATGGSGRYAHVHGHGGLYGTFDRRTFTFVIQTTGELST